MNLSLQLILIGAAESIYYHPLWLAASTKPSRKCKAGCMPTELAGSEMLNEWTRTWSSKRTVIFYARAHWTSSKTLFCSNALLKHHNKLTRDSKSTWLKIKLKSNTIYLELQDEHFSSLSKTPQLSQGLDEGRAQETWDCSLSSCSHWVWFMLAPTALLTW